MCVGIFIYICTYIITCVYKYERIKEGREYNCAICR